MASFRKRGNRWQARVIRFGYPDQVKTFSEKRDAECWARSMEVEIERGLLIDRRIADQTTLASILARYAATVCPTKRGGVIESRRLIRLSNDRIGHLSISRLKPQDIADYRDRRLKEISASTLNRELQLVGAVLNHANREWGVEFSANPVYKVRLPPAGRHRSRVLNAEEELRLLGALDGEGCKSQTTINPWVKPIVQIAIETACRRGEILSMKWENINLVSRTVRLELTKNGDDRIVPLSTRAIEILGGLPRNNFGVVFPFRWTLLHQAFKKACKRADIVDLKFHDLRHTATTRLSSKLPNLIELAAVTGHKSLAMLKRYYHTNAEDLALKIG